MLLNSCIIGSHYDGHVGFKSLCVTRCGRRYHVESSMHVITTTSWDHIEVQSHGQPQRSGSLESCVHGHEPHYAGMEVTPCGGALLKFCVNAQNDRGNASELVNCIRNV